MRWLHGCAKLPTVGMSALFLFLSLSEKPGGKLKQTAFFSPHSDRLLFDFARASDQSHRHSDDVIFDWAEPRLVRDRRHPERHLMRAHCVAPSNVLPGLRWLKAIALHPDRQTHVIWRALRSNLASHPVLREERFEPVIARDIEGLIAFCEQAQARGDFIISVRVP
jgi:hypothetical protein